MNIVKIYKKMSYKKVGEKFEANFSEGFLINLDNIAFIETIHKGDHYMTYFGDIEAFEVTDSIDFNQHKQFINSLFLPNEPKEVEQKR